MLREIFVLSAITQSFAWWCTGHMLVAMIAQIDLSQTDSKAYTQASNIVAVLNGSLSHNLSNSFVESACWADDIKNYNVSYLNSGHFYDMPYNPEGLLDTSDVSSNVLFAWNNAMSTLTKQNLTSAPFETSFSLRYLIHIAGDIHQPLHCAMLWNSDFPKGDLGGNLFNITYSSSITELHAFWDSGAGQLQDDFARPLNQSSWNFLYEKSHEIMQQWPRYLFLNDLKVKDPADWCLDSFQDAKAYAYNGAIQGQPLSQSYVDRAWQVIRRRIALAGYRLSNTLSTLY